MSSNFTSPSDDSFPHWIRSIARQYPDRPFVIYGDGHMEPKEVTWSQVAQASQRATRLINSLKDPDYNGDFPQIFGVLATLDTLTYLTLTIGITMAGCTAFLVSNKNSSAAVAHLLKKTGTRKLFVSNDDQMQKLASASLESMAADGHGVNVLQPPVFQDFYPDNAQDEVLQELPYFHQDSPAIIMHSSGSTSFPKPIPHSHRKLVEVGRSRYLIGNDLTRSIMSIHMLPVYHVFAIYAFMIATHSGATISCFPPRNPPVMPTPQSVLEAAVKCKCTILKTVPIFMEAWSRNEEDVEKLKLLETVVYSGGPLSKQVGDELTQKGVHITPIFSLSEIGIGSTVVLEGKPDPEWEWVHCRPNVPTVFLPQEDNPEAYEIVFAEGPSFSPSVFNCEVDGKRAYATNDLVLLHPKNRNRFKVIGRKDDQLMLSTGEKTNPGPIEAVICRHPFVQAAVMFGRGRNQNGIIVQPAKDHTFDPSDEAALAKFRNDIWPSVEKANHIAPSHSRLYKEMIIVTHPSKPFELTLKLLPRRHTVIQAYKDEIEAVYAAAESSAQTEIPPPSEWTPEHVQKYVRDTVQHFLNQELGDDDDIFIRGADSLNATYIRNSLVHALRQMDKEAPKRVSQDFVYSYPSISRLAKQLLVITGVTTLNAEDEIASKLKEIDEMISEFSCDFPRHQPSKTAAHQSGEVVLLTGSTGALGVQILAHLVSLPEISHVYALNRGGPKALQERQLDALVERGLDTEIINSAKVTLVEGDTSIEGFGIESRIHNEIRDSITLIIHTAWRVNFNLTVGSFKPMVRGVRNLADLSLHSPRPVPPRVIFTGTVSVFRNRKEPGRPQETSIQDPRWVLGGGYSESKFVAERILEAAAKSTTLRPIIVRIGQMSSNASGSWNSSDWLPAIVRSGQVIGALPARDDSVAWIGMDVAAQALVDFRTTQSQFLHLAHPKSTPWNALFSVFSSALHVPLVTWAEWLSKLEQDKTGPELNPAVHLLDFYRGASPIAVDNMEAPGSPFLDLTQGLKSSSTLASPSLPPLGAADAESWLRYWKNKGLLRE